jgi:hypothetical protein|tara:strand:- start:483 stop:749 length:267 start_codon:yes stop_codon:yes gene_type:complete
MNDKENPELQKTVEGTTGLKQLVVNYIGERLAVEEAVTVDMAVQVFAAEFPEFLMAVAEENFIRGYQQGLDDIEAAYNEQATTDIATV